MIIELINTGSELMLGRTLNTHQQWICRQLADIGRVVTRQTSIADTGHDIQQAVRESLSRADLILVTGGLGPTSDDLTRELVARLLGKPLREDPSIVAALKKFFSERNHPMAASNLVQAQVPEGATVLPNPHGTAPGLAMKVSPNPCRPDGKPAWLIMLPGPPRELQPMFTHSVIPLLQREFPPQLHVCHTVRTSGIGESALAEKLDAELRALVAGGLEAGYCARPGRVDVRLAARTPDAAQIVAAARQIVERLLAPHIYAHGGEEIESVIVRELAARGKTLAIAESCTGGCIAHHITNVPGSSAVLVAGFVAYSNEAKSRCLDVRVETLAAHGAVSEPVVREMAAGARAKTGADYAVAVTGIAGPGGGSPEKPVGTVFMAVCGEAGIEAARRTNRFDRETFKDVTTHQVLEMLRQFIQRKSP